MIDKVSINPAAYRKLAQTKPVAETASAEAKGSTSFSEVLKKSLSEVNADQTQADQAIADFLTGKSAGLHETMLALEKADTSVRLLVQVRNKAVDAYREIMRMQV
ncbi:MAG: flagellar hook-basal body complex protein FliE [Myxococcales bacterium]|nr:MAG: flagellar hook-basal body complex protein FliE [Myxococcales bacterium]